MNEYEMKLWGGESSRRRKQFLGIFSLHSWDMKST